MDYLKHCILFIVVVILSTTLAEDRYQLSNEDTVSVQGIPNSFRSRTKWYPTGYFGHQQDPQLMEPTYETNENYVEPEFIEYEENPSEDIIGITGFNGYGDGEIGTDVYQPNYPLDEVKRHMEERHLPNPRYQELCPVTRSVIKVADRMEMYEYDFRPDAYENITCKHNHNSPFGTDINKVCHSFAILYKPDKSIGLACYQMTKEIRIFKRKRNSTDRCWEEHETRIVNAGCECRWPQHLLNDINGYH